MELFGKKKVGWATIYTTSNTNGSSVSGTAIYEKSGLAMRRKPALTKTKMKSKLVSIAEVRLEPNLVYLVDLLRNAVVIF